MCRTVFQLGLQRRLGGSGCSPGFARFVNGVPKKSADVETCPWMTIPDATAPSAGTDIDGMGGDP